MRDIVKSHTKFNPNEIKDPENIRSLYVGHNSLEHINFSAFTNLEALDIGHNKIKNIDGLSNKIKWICIADNQIENYDSLYELTNLEYLWAHQTNININKCYKMKKLKQLLIDDCLNISNIEVIRHFNDLSILELRNNKVDDISCVKNKKLSFLNIMNNNVRDIESLSGMGTLKKLNIRGNPIKNYDALRTLNLRRLCL
mgnify:CR=1 FL=1|tara:strand:- start:683 stop:1279 length:597 start_codon:yes stop_codon:yes gene_type:complete